jgi:hypothetical protein
MPLLFSYGTLRQPAVQRSTFGRLLDGWSDEIVGFEQSVFRAEDPAFVAASGTASHAMLRPTGRTADRVAGTVFEISDAELASADAYEPAGYARIMAPLASGKTAWVYADARGVPSEDAEGRG